MNTGWNGTTVGGWVKKYRAAHAVHEPALELTERARLRELERRNRELEIENAFLKKPVLMRVIGVKCGVRRAW